MNELALTPDTTLHLVMSIPPPRENAEASDIPNSSTDAALQRATAAANRRRRRVQRRHE